MSDYIAYLEAQRKMLEQFEYRATAMAFDTATEVDQLHRSGAPWRHGLAETLRAAASRLEPTPA
jgi:hypothetical protein